MTVRAKFKCTEIMMNETGSQITLSPVIATSPENEVFFKWTPSGSIKMGLINPETAKEFVAGKEYYVDFTESK